MRSVVLCEGQDDLWFLAYYLNKRTRLDITNVSRAQWRNYKVPLLNPKQKVEYMSDGQDSVAIWCVGGKDAFQGSISIIFEQLIGNFPFDPINSVVVVEDRDDSPPDKVVATMESWFPGNPMLVNKTTVRWSSVIDEQPVSVDITPVVIPFSEQGAIETLLTGAIRDRGAEEAFIVSQANTYIDNLVQSRALNTYLSHARLITKARYAAVVAAINPEHSTALFQDLVMSCPWEQSPYVREHFDCILSAILSPQLITGEVNRPC